MSEKSFQPEKRSPSRTGRRLQKRESTPRCLGILSGPGDSRLLLQGPGEPGHIILHKKRIDEGYRHRTQQCAGHEGFPRVDVSSDKLGNDSHRHGLLERVREKDQGV